jgi:predicted nucleic acid-binding protein
LKATYLDASAIIKLVLAEPESPVLRRYLRRKRPLITCALARTEVQRAALPEGPTALGRARAELARFDMVRLSDRLLQVAGTLDPIELRSLDAIHLAAAGSLGADLGRVVTYDDRMADAARALGFNVHAPA